MDSIVLLIAFVFIVGTFFIVIVVSKSKSKSPPSNPTSSPTSSPTNKPLLNIAPFCKLDKTNAANNTCVGVEDSKPYCYGGTHIDPQTGLTIDCKWAANDCNTDADCSKYTGTTVKLNPHSYTCDYLAKQPDAYWTDTCNGIRTWIG